MTGAGNHLRVGACLSLSGRFAQFGLQAAHGLRAWRSLDQHADLVIEDDASDPAVLAQVLPDVAARCDLLLGPYSTLLMKTAGRLAADRGWLLWNHGGAGDDIQAARPGHVVSVLTPASRYAAPFVRRLAADEPATQLRIARGTGRFGAQVSRGAEELARNNGIQVLAGPAEEILTATAPDGWTLLAAGTFEHDVAAVGRARRLASPPRRVCAVAAGVRAFAQAAAADGIFGLAQWFPGTGPEPRLGPSRDAFIARCTQIAGTRPDYPAAQAAAAASIAAHCARAAGTTARGPLWRAATGLDTVTLFGRFRADPVTGVQLEHQTVLLRWAGRELRQDR